MPVLLLIKATNYSKLETIGLNSKPRTRLTIQSKTIRKAGDLQQARTTRRAAQ